MEQLVEVKLLDDVLLLTCHSNMTIAEMSLVALSEYDTAHINNTPKNVQHVKDSKGRILSGTIKLGGLQTQSAFEIIVYDESYVQTKVLDPPTLKMMHDKWSIFTVYQVEQYLNSVSHNESESFESRDIFGILDDLKHSKSETVQGHVVKCLDLMLNTSKNGVFVKYITDELHTLFKSTVHESIALNILKLIQKVYKVSKKSIKVEDLMDSVYSKIKTFGCSNEEFLKYCDYHVDEEKESYRSEDKPSPRRLKTKVLSTNEDKSLCPSVGSMNLPRVIELLESVDTSCRSVALEKVSKCAEQEKRRGSRTSRQEQHDGDDVDIASEIRSPEDADELLRALFGCLKKSIKPPGEILGKATKVRQPLAFLIADKSLHSTESFFSAILSCIKCIHWVVKRWEYDSSVIILSEKWRILLTLAHASDRQDEDLEISEKCGELLMLLTNSHGWGKYSIRLEKDSITYFLGSERPLMRTLLALSFIGSFNFEVPEGQLRESRGNAITSILCSNEFANLRSIWRWSIGNYSQNVCVQALEVLSSAVVLSEVRSHLIKYDPIEKLLRLLEEYVSSEMDNRSGRSSDSRANTCIIHFSLKTIANLYSTASSPLASRQSSTLEKALKGTQLGSDLSLLGTVDDVVGFYMKLLAVD